MAKSATYGTVAPFSRIVNLRGLEFGIGDWNVQACSLQPLLIKFSVASPSSFSAIIGEKTKELISMLRQPCDKSAEQLNRLFHSSDGGITPDWVAKFRALGADQTFEQIELDEAKPLFDSAVKCAVDAGLRSELGVTFCFDLNRWVVDDRVLGAALDEAVADSAAFQKQEKRPPDQLEKLYIFVNRVGDPHNYTPPQDQGLAMLSRILGYSIADGRSWPGQPFVELEDLGLGMRDFETGQPIPVHRDKALLDEFRSGWFPSEPDRLAWHP